MRHRSQEATDPLSLISEAATKDGLPRASFAYTPTDEPSTWRLPYLTAVGAPDPSHLPGAAAAVSSGGFRGERVDVPSSAIPVIKAKLRSAYRRWGKPATEWPESIREDGALVEQALDWAFREDTGSDPDDGEWLMDLAMNERSGIREAAGDEHFYGHWRGGKASAGGGPASEKGKGSAEQRRSEMAKRVGAENVGNTDNLPTSKRPASARSEGQSRRQRNVRDNARMDAATDREHESWGRKAGTDATNATKRRIGIDSPNYSSERFGDLHGRWEKVRDAAIAKGADGEAIDRLRTNFARGAAVPAYRLNAPTVPTRYAPIQRGSREMALLRAKAEKGDRNAAREINRISDSRRGVREADVMELINWATTGASPTAIRPPSAGATARASLAARHAARLSRDTAGIGPITTTPAQARANLSRRLGRA